ncbi:hypothetical protein [Alicyclobacillus fodiniaquatilis]|uniref:Aminoglycoside phosphotransferase domain-containing protein n=1 Tax=Alicyclobacillus fodiniaquatilis TaxID=1661150 RepID=A0ABW4JNL8_9BACL
MIKQIESAYGFSINSYIPAPRGWWAETYVLDTSRGKYFIKIFVDEMCFETELSASLDIHFEMAEHIEYIPKPIRTVDGILLHTLDNNRVVALYTHINGTNFKTNDARLILSLMANIYKLDIKCKNHCQFPLYGKKIMNDLLTDKYHTKSEILIGHMKRNRDFFMKYWSIYEELVYKVRNKQNKLYLTHGDLGVNLMIDNNRKIFIVDWDSIHLGPIERDLREYIDSSTDIGQLEAIAKNAGLYWEFDKDYHNYFLLNGLYDDLGNFFYEIDLEAADGEIKIAERTTGQQQYINTIEDRLIF